MPEYERAEARDLRRNLHATLTLRPEFVRASFGRWSQTSDALLLSERLHVTGMTTASGEHLASYEDVDPLDASAMRDLLLSWLKEANN